MKFIGRIIDRGARAALALAIATPLAFSQMGGGMGSGGMGSGGNMPGGSGTPGSGMPGSGAGGGMPGSGMMDGGMPGGMMGAGMGMTGPTVGPDGTAYVVRRTVVTPQTSNAQAQVKPELVAINVKDGTPKWTLGIDGWMASEPAFGKDGRIFLTASDGGVTDSKSALLVIIADQLSARIANRVEVGGDVLSAPRIAADDASYVVYVIATEMGGMMDAGPNDSPAGSTLYAFLPDGRQKFKVQLTQSQGTGSPGPK